MNCSFRRIKTFLVILFLAALMSFSSQSLLGIGWTVGLTSSLPESAWWDEGYAANRNLSILNNDSDSLPIGYPVHIHFDSNTIPTASEIFNSSLSSVKGDDLRIVYQDQTELDRHIENFSFIEIDFWFPLQQTVGGGQTDSANYQMYITNSDAVGPPDAINNVFLPEADANTVGIWHFTENNGSTVADSSGNGHDGTFNGANWTDGLMGSAGLFNGTSAYVDAGNSGAFNLASGPMTIEAWIYLTGSTDEFPHVVSKWGPGDGSYFLRVNGDQTLEWKLRGTGAQTLSATEQFSLNEWYHFAATYDGTNTMEIYINGILRGSLSNGADGFSTSRSLFIGYAETGADGTYFPGYIQHVRVSNIVRGSFPYGKITDQPTVTIGDLIQPIYLPIVRSNFPFCFNGPVEEEPNDSAGEANGPICDSGSFFGLPLDEKDYFSFITDESGQMTLRLKDHPLEDEDGAQLLLYFETDLVIPVATDVVRPYVITHTGPAGTYYIQVFTDQTKCPPCSTQYELEIELP
jgi:hypothetical protein